MDVMWDLVINGRHVGLVYEWTLCGTWFMNGRYVGLVYEWTSCGTWFMNGRYVGLGL